MEGYGRFFLGLFIIWLCAVFLWGEAGLSNGPTDDKHFAFVTFGLMPMIVFFRVRISLYYQKHEDFSFTRKDIVSSILALVYLGVLLYISDVNLPKALVVGAIIVGVFLISLRINNWDE